MRIEWKTGKPERNGEYVVIYRWGSVTTLQYTKEYGWNTTGADNKEFAMPDDDIVVWCEDFSKHVIDIYGHRDIIRGKEVDNGERVQCD